MRTIFPIKQFQGQYCLSPFVMIEVTLNGDVRMCGCGDWMPITIGNLTQNTLKEILSSYLAQKIRQSIIDGSYVYCNEKLCGVISWYRGPSQKMAGSPLGRSGALFNQAKLGGVVTVGF